MAEVKNCGTQVPHGPHGWPLNSGVMHTFDCPGVPVPQSTGSESS